MAIVGNGDIASVLPERDDLLFFASGVSNSQLDDPVEFTREKDLLMSQDFSKHIVYFGSLAVFYSDTPYTRHKRDMERRVKANFAHYTIMRLGNIAWGSNPNTLINYLSEHPDAELRDEYRYVIEEEEFLHWVDLIPKWNEVMNCPGQQLKVKEIYEQYVRPHTEEV